MGSPTPAQLCLGRCQQAAALLPGRCFSQQRCPALVGSGIRASSLSRCPGVGESHLSFCFVALRETFFFLEFVSRTGGSSRNDENEVLGVEWLMLMFSFYGLG